jgi:hypothetical protein
MPTKRQEKERLFQLIGWVFFLICSFFFIADSLATRSPLGLAGNVAFFLGCIVFLVPFTWKSE